MYRYLIHTNKACAFYENSDLAREEFIQARTPSWTARALGVTSVVQVQGPAEKPIKRRGPKKHDGDPLD